MVADPGVLSWLRSCRCQWSGCGHVQAADEIERLVAETRRLSLDLMTCLGELMEATRD